MGGKLSTVARGFTIVKEFSSLCRRIGLNRKVTNQWGPGMNEQNRNDLDRFDLPVIDLHSDLLTDVVLRRQGGERRVLATRHLTGLLAGGVSAVVAAIWVEWAGDAANAWRLARRYVEALTSEIIETPGLQLVRSPEELEAARCAGRLGIILAAEGLGFLNGDPEQLDGWHALGLRVASLTWNGSNPFACGQGVGAGGVTKLGRVALQRMADLGLVLDVSHLSDEAFWHAIDGFPGVVIASHSNARALCDHPRNLTDDQIQALTRRGGLIGLNAYPPFVDVHAPSLERYLDHAAYLAEKFGVEYVAFGFDFTGYLPSTAADAVGGPGQMRSLPGLAGPEDVPNLLEGLRRRGFVEKEIRALAWDNWLRVWGQSRPAR